MTKDRLLDTTALSIRADDAPLERLAVSIPEVVAMTGLGRSLIYEAIGRKELIAHKATSRTIVLVEDLRAWLHDLPRFEGAKQQAVESPMHAGVIAADSGEGGNEQR